jgi:uncharacterized MnhB-related membrane protein
VPVALIVVAVLGRPAMMSAVVGLAEAVVGIGVCALLFRRALRRLQREDLLTRWR